MVNIEIASKLTCKIRFKFNKIVLNIIKILPSRRWNDEDKYWEIPKTLLPLFISNLEKNKISYETIELAKEAPKKKPAKTTNFKFKTAPFQHQIEGFNYGMEKESFILGDEQGLGKTKQTIDIAVGRKEKGHVKKCLIICGVNGLKWNWKKEISIHSNEQSVILGEKINKKGNIIIGSALDKLAHLQNWHKESFFLITNVETLRDINILAELKEQCKIGIIDMIIVDECHKCKNPTSQQGKALLGLKSKYNIALSGTPLMNNILDLYVPLNWIGAEKLNFFAYKNYYCVFGGFGNREIVGHKNLEILRESVEKNTLRRLKEDVLDLPEKIRTLEYVDMGTKQAKIYKEVHAEVLENIDLIKSSNNPLAELLRLRQATGYTGILSSTIQESAKYERALEIIEDIISNDGNVIIFSNWTKIINPMIEKLKKYKPAVITGETKDREAELEKFMKNKSCRIICGTTSAMGTGLTLTKANYVLFLDSPWNRANKEQAEDRAHRIGTKGTVNIITLVCKNTIDEKIEQLIQEKGDLADLMVDGKIGNRRKTEMLDFLLS